jgi:D-aspartate ligase
MTTLQAREMELMSNIDKNRPGAIVLGGNFVGLGIVRSLGAHGIPTWVFDADRSKSIAQFSRYTTRFVETKAEITDVLLAEGRKHQLNGWVIFPVADDYVEILAANHQSLSSIYRVTTPPLEITRFALDKRLTYRRAAELGIAAPWTSVGNSLAELEAEGIPYPVILKPAINHHFFPQTNVKALPVENPSELQRAFAQMSKYIPPDEILVQERIPGSGENQFSFCAVCQDGHAYASLVAQRRRQYPVEFGNASTFVETTSQPVVEAAGRRFLESIGFDGVAEVEFKFDPRDGKYKILDVNPRTWGWHTLGKAAGMDFPYLLWRQAVGLPVAPIATHHRAAWIREITDVVAIAKSRNRMAEVKLLLKALCRGKFTSATFSLLDPVPFFAEFVLWASSGVSRQKKAKGFLALDPVGPNPESGARTGWAPGEVRSADASTLPLADVRAANSPMVARFGLADLAGRKSQHPAPETGEVREAATRPRE